MHKQKYIRSYLSSLYSIYKKNESYFSYLKNDFTTHDSIYFIDQHLNHDIAATYHALPMLEDHFAEKLKSLCNELKSDANKSPATAKINWTDEKIHLVELIYALHHCGCFNKGKAHINQITACMEAAFSIKLNNINRSFQDIKSRQHQTKFLDHMKKCLAKQLELNFN